MPNKGTPRPADFELLCPEDQERIRVIRQTIIDVAMGNMPSIGFFESDNPRLSAAWLVLRLSGGNEVRDPADMLRLTGMNDEEINAAIGVSQTL